MPAAGAVGANGRCDSRRLERPRLWCQDDALVEVSVLVVGDDGRAFATKVVPTQMIEVIVGVDEIAIGLPEGPLGFGDDGERALLIERPSITVTKSLNSTATLLCEPPP